MKQLIVAAVAATVLGAALPAFAQNIAVVNGKAVPKSRLDALTAQLAKSGRPVPPEAQPQLREEVIAREIFMQEAQRRGLDASDDFKQQMELARQTILIRELFVDWAKANPVGDDEVKAEYDKFAAANAGKEYKARHILVDDEAKARALIAQLKKGAKFETLAKESKDTGSAANGGDLDWANASNYVPEFAQALVALKKGQLTDAPVKTQYGWHVIRVDDIREAQLPPLEQLKPQIVQKIQQDKLSKFQEDLRGKAKVE